MDSAFIGVENAKIKKSEFFAEKDLMSFGRCGRQCSLIPLGGYRNEKR